MNWVGFPLYAMIPPWYYGLHQTCLPIGLIHSNVKGFAILRPTHNTHNLLGRIEKLTWRMKWMPFLVNFRVPTFLLIKCDMSIFMSWLQLNISDLQRLLYVIICMVLFFFPKKIGPALRSEVFNHILFHFPIFVTVYLIKPIQMVSTKSMQPMVKLLCGASRNPKNREFSLVISLWFLHIQMSDVMAYRMVVAIIHVHPFLMKVFPIESGSLQLDTIRLNWYSVLLKHRSWNLHSLLNYEISFPSGLVLKRHRKHW